MDWAEGSDRPDSLHHTDRSTLGSDRKDIGYLGTAAKSMVFGSSNSSCWVSDTDSEITRRTSIRRNNRSVGRIDNFGSRS